MTHSFCTFPLFRFSLCLLVLFFFSACEPAEQRRFQELLGPYQGPTISYRQDFREVYDSVGNVIDLVGYVDTLLSEQDTLWVTAAEEAALGFRVRGGGSIAVINGYADSLFIWDQNVIFNTGFANPGYYLETLYGEFAGSDSLRIEFYTESTSATQPTTWSRTFFQGKKE